MRLANYFYKSLYNFLWLKEQKDKPRPAWAYFFSLMLIMALFVVVPFLLALPGMVKDWRTKLGEAPNFQAVLNNGAFTITGVPQPLIVKGLGENFIVVIDTASTTTSTLDSYLENSAQSGLLVTGEKVELYNDITGEQKTQKWKGAPDFSINKTKLNELAGKYLNFSWLAAGSVLFFILVFLGNVIVRLLALLSVVLIVFILTRLARQSWKFKELFTIGLFAITLPLLLETVLGALSGAMIPIFFLALLAFMLALVFTKEGESSVIARPTGGDRGNPQS